MSGPLSFLWRRCLLVAMLSLIVASPPPADAAAMGYAGRPVVEILREFQGRGLTLIYNDDLVPPGLLVRREPAATDDVGILTDILAPHGLALRAAGTNAWSIVSARALPATLAARGARRGRSVRDLPLDEVVVTTSRYALAQDDAGSHTFLTQAEVQSLPRLGDEALRAIHRLPGAASNGLSGLAHIRGGEENETAIVLDGMALYEPFHLKNFFSPVSVLDSRIVQSLDVYAGGFPAEYGGRMSAVVDATSLEPPRGGYYELGLSLFHTSGLASGSFDDDRGSWLVSARRSNLGVVADAVKAEIGDPRYFDSFARLRYAFSDLTSGSLELLVSQDRLDVNNTAETEFSEATYRNVYVWGTVEHSWNDRLSGRAIVAYTQVDNRRDGTVDDPGQRLGAVNDQRNYEISSLKLDGQYGDDRLRYRFGVEASSLEAGYRYQSSLLLAAGFPFPGDPAQSIERQFRLTPDGASFGAWASGRWRISPRLTAELGLRWDEQTYDQVDGATQLSPRINLLYEIGPRTRLRASWGRFFQAQGINELQVEDGVDRFSRPQRADHAILSLEQGIGTDLALRIEAYDKSYNELKTRFENLFDPVVLIPELQADRVAVAPESGEARGVEILLRETAEGTWGWWLSYAWSRAEETLATGEVPRSWDQRTTLNGGLNWVSGPWDITLAGTWHTGWPTTPATLTLTDDGLGGQTPAVVVGEHNSARYRDFGSVDFRAGYTFELSRGELQTFFELTNAFARENPCCVKYQVVPTPDDSFRLATDFDNWPRFVPNLGVLWKF